MYLYVQVHDNLHFIKWVKPTVGVFPKCRAGLIYHLTINMFCYSRTGSNRKSQKRNLKELQMKASKIPSSSKHLHKYL
jgi:hypothetical protein